MPHHYAEWFHLPPGIYWLNHSLGCLPKSTGEAAAQFTDSWRDHAAHAWDFWQAEVEKFNLALAQLFNSRAELFCPQTNISSAAAKILYSINQDCKRKTIVLAEEDFPSLGFLYQAAAKYGYQLKFFPKQISLNDLALWDRLLDDKVQWLHLSHVTSQASELVPIIQLVQMARERDILTVVDVAQSAGVIPLDLVELNAHFVIGSCIKWLCGGPGAGFLWVHPDMLPQCQPRDLGWFSHEDPFEFDIHHFEFARNAKRFWGGTPSVQAFMLARHSIEVINKIGVENIRKHNKKLLQQFTNGLSKYFTLDDEIPRGGTLCLGHKDPQGLLHALKNENIHADRRAKGLRLSPHIYNSEDEVEKSLQVIYRFLSQHSRP